MEEVVDLMRPAIRADGGDIALLAVDEEAGVVTVDLPGGCNTSGAVARSSLEAGVERILRERVPAINEVRYASGADHACDQPGEACAHPGEACAHR